MTEKDATSDRQAALRALPLLCGRTLAEFAAETWRAEGNP